MGKYLDSTGLSHFMGLLKSKLLPSGGSAGQVLAKTSATDHEVGWVTHSYAAAPAAGGNAAKANAILYGTVDSTSTATVFTATVEGLTELVDGTCVMLHNGVVTSASGFTVNVNGLGAKPCYSNMTNATRDTTIFNIAYTMLFVYSSALNEGDGGWWIYRGYDANTNTIGYQVRTNSGTLPTTAKFYRYRILFTSADGTHWVPSNTSASTNATAKRDVIQTPINPFGPIVYYGTTTAVEANANVAAAQLWQQYTLTFGYAFNRTDAALVLSYPAPIYIKCAPQANGSAIIDADTPYVQALPSSKDGKIYIFLGIAYSATSVELRTEHPIYWHDGTGLRMWTGAEPLEFVAGSNITLTPDATNSKITIAATDNDTKNTAGSTNNASKLYLIGATSQDANPQTYSQAAVYAQSGNLYASTINDVTISDGSANGLLLQGGYSSLTVEPNKYYILAEACEHGVEDSIVSGTTSDGLTTAESVANYVDTAMSNMMEDTAVDAAVEAAFPAPTGYTITPIGQASPDAIYCHCNGIGTTDSFAAGTYVSTADAGTTIYVALDSDYEPVVTRTDTSATLTYSLYGPGVAGKLWTFTMPEADVTVDVFYND